MIVNDIVDEIVTCGRAFRVVESTTVTHSSADWSGGIDGFSSVPSKDTWPWGKRNCQGSETKFSAAGFEPGRDDPVACLSQRSLSLTHSVSATAPPLTGHDWSLDPGPRTRY